MRTYDTDAVTHGMTGKVPVEAGTHSAGVTVDAGNLAPDGADAGLALGMLWHALLGLSLVDIDATLADVELTVFLAAGTLDL